MVSDRQVDGIKVVRLKELSCSSHFFRIRNQKTRNESSEENFEENAPLKAARVMARVRECHGGRDYDAQFGKRRTGEGTYAQLIAHRFKLATRRQGLTTNLPALRTDLFAIPPRSGDQLSLF